MSDYRGAPREGQVLTVKGVGNVGNGGSIPELNCDGVM